MSRLSQFVSDCKAAGELWYEHDADFMAATVSYYALFAIAPLLLLSVTLTGLVFGEPYVADVLKEWGSILGADLIGLLSEAVVNLDSTASSLLPIFGIVFFSGMLVFTLNAFTSGLHTLWGVPHQGVRGWLKKCLRSTSFIVLFEVYLLVLIGMHKVIAAFGVPNGLADIFSVVSTIFVTTLLFAGMFRILPWWWPSFSGRLIGAFVASVLFVIGKSLVGFYVSLTPVPGLFGTAGLLVVLLIWVYAIVSILYYGAALACVANRGAR